MLNEILHQLRHDFLVPLSDEEAAQCETIDDLEHYVYEQIAQHRLGASQIQAFRLTILDKINCAVRLDLSEPLSEADFDSDLAELALQRMTENWERTYLQIGLPINRHGIRIETPRWASRLCDWSFLALFFAAVMLWYFLGAAVGLLSLVACFVLATMVSRWVPYRTVKDTTTLREAIDHYIEEIEERVRDVTLWDVQVRVRSIYAALKEVDQASLNGLTLL